MVRLTTVSGAFAAHVLAARLDDEGFDVQLRGALHSPYPLAVGGWGDVDVFVPEDQVDEASYVLLVTEIDAAKATMPSLASNCPQACAGPEEQALASMIAR